MAFPTPSPDTSDAPDASAASDTPDAPRLAAAREALAAAERAARAPGGGRAEDLPATEGPGIAPARSRSRSAAATEGSDAGAGAAAADPEQLARQIVLRQLSVGPRTRKQLADKLRERGCADEVAQRVLDRMTEVGLVDDESYAEMFVRSRRETKGLATPALRHELRQKGVADDVAERVLQEVQPEHERASAEALVARRLRTMHGLDREVQTRRLAGFLARKGYSAGLSYEVIRDALLQAEEHRRD
jgi:regulatory protein